MIWVILALLGVPLWIVALGLLILFIQNRRLRKRPGDLPVRVQRSGKKGWKRGHGLWVSDVFAFTPSPAGTESLFHVSGATMRPARPEDGTFRRLGDDPVIATLALANGEDLPVAARSTLRGALLGPFSGRPEP